jgi:hypothetical protein
LVFVRCLIKLGMAIQRTGQKKVFLWRFSVCFYLSEQTQGKQIFLSPSGIEVRGQFRADTLTLVPSGRQMSEG